MSAEKNTTFQNWRFPHYSAPERLSFGLGAARTRANPGIEELGNHLDLRIIAPERQLFKSLTQGCEDAKSYDLSLPEFT